MTMGTVARSVARPSSTDALVDLVVGDDGVGMPPDAADAKPGLGTSIVEALARQLHARVRVTAEIPSGTKISVNHFQIAAIGEDGESAHLAV